MSQPQEAIQSGPGRHAIYLILEVGVADADVAGAREACAAVPTLVRAVGQRDDRAALSCVVAIGADAWDRLAPGRGRPAQLHPFRALRDGPRSAPSTPGDVLLHIRAERQDLCHELARLIRMRFGGVARVIEEIHGFAYLDSRDLVGFVDGTENPTGEERRAFTLVGDEDPDHTGGSYVTVQRYVTDFARWGSLPTEAQEAVIGRTKADDVELADDVCPPTAHKERAKIVRDGQEQKILRQNRAYGTTTEAGTFFIAYARDVSVTEEMLERMVIADENGHYDHLLDFARAVSGTNFFAPALDVLEALADDPDPPAEVAGAPSEPEQERDGSLRIGALRGRS